MKYLYYDHLPLYQSNHHQLYELDLNMDMIMVIEFLKYHVKFFMLLYDSIVVAMRYVLLARVRIRFLLF